jgi:hypothetical protein
LVRSVSVEIAGLLYGKEGACLLARTVMDFVKNCQCQCSMEQWRKSDNSELGAFFLGVFAQKK